LKTAPKIRELNLYYSEWITDQGLTAIAGWKHLRRLNVRGTRVSDGTLEIVAKLTDLEALDIAHTQVTDNGLEHLITLVQLKELAMGGGRRSPAAFTVLRMLPTLTYLDLSGARPGAPDMANRESTGPGIPEQTLKAIAELKDLKVLKLGHSNITSGGLKTLQSLDKVEKLGLEGCKRIDDSSIEILGQWKSLKYLDLQDTQVSAGAIEGLRKARPELAVLSVKK
jgi:hypothetical protein